MKNPFSVREELSLVSVLHAKEIQIAVLVLPSLVRVSFHDVLILPAGQMLVSVTVGQ